MNKYYFAIVLSTTLFASCKEEIRYGKVPFFDSCKKYIGDSIFENSRLVRLTFIDTSYEIDSIVFSRYNNSSNTLKSVHTYKKGKPVFENIEYYQNGVVKKYSFIDEDNPNYYYERLYHDNGALIKINGYLFFQGFIVDTASKNLNIKVGSTINYRIYYPNPPDCVSHIYIKNDDGSMYDVFKKSIFMNFLQTTYQDNSTEGVYKVNVMLEQKDKSMDTTVYYNRPFIYQVDR
jgi:hypothetical protein